MPLLVRQFVAEEQGVHRLLHHQKSANSMQSLDTAYVISLQ